MPDRLLEFKEIAAIRAKLNVSQAVFADLLNVPKAKIPTAS